jgi:hypothetical protein
VRKIKRTTNGDLAFHTWGNIDIALGELRRIKSSLKATFGSQGLS